MVSFQEVWALLTSGNSELWQIIGVTLRLSFSSTLIAMCIGIPLGALIAMRSFPGKRILMRIITTLMGLPPVVAGLLVFFLLSRSGPLGQYKLLYSVSAMVLAQVLIITPIVIGLAVSTIEARYTLLRETAAGIGLPLGKRLLYVLYECRTQLFAILFTGFGRAISEVGAAQIVGGNIQYKTRTMTTAIVMETNMGRFSLALALGIVLLLIAFIITSIVHLLDKERWRGA